MIVNCINVLTRTDRLSHFKQQAAEQDFEYRIWEGMVHPNKPYLGISRSHKMIVHHAKDNNLPMCCIAEDDVKFSSPNAFNYFIENIPTDFDLYLGCIYHGDILPDNTVLEFSSLILYVIHSRFYNTFISLSEKSNIDRMLSMKGKFVVSNPFVCTQTGGYSDNAKAPIDEYEFNKKYLGQRKFYRSTD